MTSPMIGEYCDSTPSSLISSSNHLFIHFHSDFVNTGPGFILEYNATSKSLGHFLSRGKKKHTSWNFSKHDLWPILTWGPSINEVCNFSGFLTYPHPLPHVTSFYYYPLVILTNFLSLPPSQPIFSVGIPWPFMMVIQEHHILLFYLEKGYFLISPPSIASSSQEPKTKRIFQIQQGLEGRTDRAQPSRPSLKNCQNGTF